MAPSEIDFEIENRRICKTDGCNKASTLQCPKCLQLGIKESYFCSQECFKGYYNTHKYIHQTLLSDIETRSGFLYYDPWPSFTFSGSLRPCPVTPHKPVQIEIPKPDYVDHPEGASRVEEESKGKEIKVLTPEEIDDLVIACRLGREVIDEAAGAISVGVTTDEIDRIVHEACVDRECYPSPLGYYKFPKSCCTSVNEVICHGIPDLRPLRDGDIVNVDVTVYHRGYHGDLNETFFVGNVDEDSKRLVQSTYECLKYAIEAVKPGTKYRDIGAIIQKHATANKLSVVRSYCGHGIHKLFHTAPNVPHYAKNKARGVMKPGHAFTIEPMINAGTYHDRMWPDNWTAVTIDGKRSAQFEQTLLVTDDGCRILTERQSNGGRPHFMDTIDIK